MVDTADGGAATVVVVDTGRGGLWVHLSFIPLLYEPSSACQGGLAPVIRELCVVRGDPARECCWFVALTRPGSCIRCTAQHPSFAV